MHRKIYCPRFLTGTEFKWINNVEATDSPEKADIIVFSGGADINPALYNCKPKGTSYFSQERDELEVNCFNSLSPNQLVIGLCRGAQLVTALNGGKLIQDTTGHASGPHMITNKEYKFKIESIHHQMMYPFDMDKKDYDLLYWSSRKLSKYYEGDQIQDPPCEPEVILYHVKDRPVCLAIQGHPEMMNRCTAHKVLNDIIKHIQ